MKLKNFFLTGFIILFFPFCLHAQTVTIDETTTHQTIEGWGTASYVEDWIWGNQDAKDAYVNLGCNIFRVHIVPGIFTDPSGDLSGPEVPLGSDINTNITKFDFEVNDFRYNDEMVNWLSTNALEPSRVKIIASIWSPPHWTKAPTGLSTNSVCGDPEAVTPFIGCFGGASVGGTWDDGTYQNDYFQYNARFIAALCKGFEEHSGVPFYGLSIQNEAGYENPFNSCSLFTAPKSEKTAGGTSNDYTQYANALKAVKDEFALHPEITTKIMGPHHANLHQSPSNPYGMLAQMNAIQAVKDHSDASLIDFLGMYTHNYSASTATRAEMFAGYWDGIDNVSASWAAWGYPQVMHQGISSDGKQTWNSEFGGHGTDWSGALGLSLDMHTQLVYGHESALIYWTFCEDNHNVHNLVKNADLTNPENSFKYCAYKHFSRYIRPGSKRVKATFGSGAACYDGTSDLDADNAINVSAYVHETDGRVTIVFVNMKSSQYTVTVNVPTNPAVTTFEAYQTTSTDHFSKLSDVNASSGQISVTVPSEGILTLTGLGPTTVGISTSSLPDGQLGEAYNESLSASGGAQPYSWSVTSGSLPDGLNLNSNTGVISGTPTVEGDFNFTIQVEDDNTETATADLAISIIDVDDQAPTAPDNLSYNNVTSSSVDLSWDASSDNVGVTGYDVYMDGNLEKSVSGTSTTITGLSPATTYTFKVRAKDAEDNTSGFSSTVSPTTNGLDVTFTVKDDAGDPVVGATIEFNGTSENTDQNGEATFEDVSPGNDLAYTITLAGYEENTGTIDVTDSNVSDNLTLIPVAVSQISKDIIKINPNPVHSNLTIGNLKNATRLFILDMTGQILQEEVITGNTKVMDVSNLTKGCYFLKINFSNGQVITRKLIKN